MKQKIEKWDRWLNKIEEEVTWLLVAKDIFWEVQYIVSSNPSIQKSSSLYSFLATGYANSCLMGVRRLTKESRNSISFMGLLRDIHDNYELLSKAYFVSLYRDEMKDIASEEFDQCPWTESGFINSVLVKGDMDRLFETTNRCIEYTDKGVAHIDRRGIEAIPTFSELDECIDFLEELLKKYTYLMKAIDNDSFLPVYQYDWKEIFYVPWIS